MANTNNASLLCLQKEDLVEIEKEIVREFSLIRVRNIQEISLLAHQVQILLNFYTKLGSTSRLGKMVKHASLACHKELSRAKYLQSFLFLQAPFAKITLDESMYIIQEFGAKLF
jgi:hypothetical protein